jgi:N-acetylglucosamine kinase-like BadF-type ATPase
LRLIVAAGVDGGSSSTRCIAIETESWHLATSRSGPSNIFSAGPEKTLASVNEALNTALNKLGTDEADIVALCLSGAWAAHDKLTKLFAGRIRARKVLIRSDVEAATAACLGPEKRGIVVVAGTGSVVVGVAGNSLVRAGGWGPIFNDEGGAYDVSVKALRAAFESYDGRGEKTNLEVAARLFFKVRRLEDLARLAHKIERERIARFAVVVKSKADDGDRVAMSILEDAAASLSRGVIAVAEKIGITTDEALNVYLVGGMFTGKSGMLTKSMHKHISSRYRNFNIKRPTYPPTLGALAIALRALNMELPDWVARRVCRQIHKA